VATIRTSDREVRDIALEPKPVADFYTETVSALRTLGIPIHIQATPNEVDPAIPFAHDHQHCSYDREAAHMFWRQLIAADRVMHQFRASFIGKASPVHFFWGAMDLACTRFSGRPAPPHPGGAPNVGDWVMVEAYSHELSSCGFWPGGGEEGAFYSYAYPEPDGFADYRIGPAEAAYDKDLGEYVLPYEAVRTAQSPEHALLEFFKTTYQAAANTRTPDIAQELVRAHRWDLML
jgi:hypothetical protein